MLERLNPQSPTPLYEQIASRIRVAVAAGELQPGAALPSVRTLAQRLRINPATVVQAYRALEADGFVEVRHGAGTFVKQIEGEHGACERRDRPRELVRGMLDAARKLGVGTEDLVAVLAQELGVKTSRATESRALP